MSYNVKWWICFTVVLATAFIIDGTSNVVIQTVAGCIALAATGFVVYNHFKSL